MLAMQYSIQLPEDFDARAVRERVNTRSKLFDDHSGLVHKSFLYNDEDKLYAPFYIWQDVAQARQFLLDDLFKGVVATFNRHRVRNWMVMQLRYGNRSITPTFARREVDVIPAEEPLSEFVARDKAMQDKLARDPALYMHLLAVDTDRWEVLHFSLWKDRISAPKAAGDSYITYDVLHVSEPGSEVK